MRRLSLPLALLASASVATAQNLVVHYQLNETTGTNCVDSSPNQLDGTYRGGVTLGQMAGSGACVSSVDFDDAAASDVIITGAPQLEMNSNLTVCAWVNPDVIPPANAARRIFGNDNGGWTCGLWGDGLIFTTRFVKDYLLPSAPVMAGAWNHVAFVFDSNFDVTFYVNGVVAGTDTGSSPPSFFNPDWFIGGFDGSIEFFDGLIDDVQVYDAGLSTAQILMLSQSPCSTLNGPATLGTPYCTPAVSNSTGAPAGISATGSTAVSANAFTLECSDLPANSFAFFLTSRTQGLVSMPGGSSGDLCLGGAIGRFVGPGQVQSAGATGAVQLALDLTAHPTPTGLVSVAAGETWNFQCWYRDALMGTATSNFSDGLEVNFF